MFHVCCVIPGGSGHYAATVFCLGLAAAISVVIHAKVVAHLVCNGGGDTDKLWRVILSIQI